MPQQPAHLYNQSTTSELLWIIATYVELSCHQNRQVINNNSVTIYQFESIQVATRLINSKLMNRFTETIHSFYLFNGIVARKCQQIDFYQT